MELKRPVFILCVLALFATATAQVGDCELSDLFTGGSLEREMSGAIIHDSPEITVLRNHTVCLSVGSTRGKISSISLVITYTCKRSFFCRSREQFSIEQFDFGCTSQGQWSHVQFSDYGRSHTRNPTANFSTSLRTDCGACFPVHPDTTNPPTIDPVTHCHECRGCSNTTGQLACYDLFARGCCNVYVNDMCADTCPYDTYATDLNFTCVQLCPDLGNTVLNGRLNYSFVEPSSSGGGPEDIATERGYPEGSTATITCEEGYRTNGSVISCQNGNWSGGLPECIIVDCGDPPPLENATPLSHNSTVFGSNVTYLCISDGIIKQRTCLASGKWSDMDITCAQLCLDLGNKVGHGSVVYSQSPVKQSGSGSSSDAANTTQSSLQEGYLEGSIANVSCEEGYKTEGSTITCHNGNWSGHLPECISITSMPTAIDQASPSVTTSAMPTDASTTTPTEEGGGGSEGDVVAGGVIGVFVFTLAVVFVIIGMLILRQRKLNWTKHHSYRAKLYIDTTLNQAEPAIMEFPDDFNVVEGERVELQVRVTGTPEAKLMWYHDGEEVVADSSTELAENGTLTLPSAETRHGGVYQLVAESTAGRVEREVELNVSVEKEESQTITSQPQPVREFGTIPVAMFGEHVEKNHASVNKGFNEEFQDLHSGAVKSIAFSSSVENKPYNRFKNICPYDDNRVVLKQYSGHEDCQHDYINASYVDGYSKQAAFIATQGPLVNTVVDLWRMVWQERSPSIVMITNLEEGGKAKCQQYWPDVGTLQCGPLDITITDQQILADYTIRRFAVKLSGGSKHYLKVTQYHYTAWPDHGVPDYATSILAFHRRVKKEHEASKGPIIVHCSAGVGRTGTFITLDICLEQVKSENAVNIPNVINNVRQQRLLLVQTVAQYVFIHDAILEYLTCGDTQINAADLRTAIADLTKQNEPSRVTGFQNQFAILNQVTPKACEVNAMAAHKNATKNRSMDFVPDDRWRVLLKGQEGDYIHATRTNGYKLKNAYIITQGPMEGTCGDFWKMVHDRKCGVIVMTSDLVEKGREVCYQYWPSSGSGVYGEYTVELLNEEKLEGFVLRTLSVLTKSGHTHRVSQLHITNWAPDGSCSNLKTVTGVIEEVAKVQRRTENHSIVVHCSDTVSRSGMFCATATAIDQCKTEGVVNVFQVVKMLRLQKPGAVTTLVQYMTVFEAVLTFLDSFETYANFQKK